MCVPSHSVVSHSETQGLEPGGLLCPWDFPGKNTGVGCHFLLQGIFPTQGSNPNLLHWQVDYLPLSHRRSPSAYTLHDFNSTMTVPLDHTGSKKELKMQVLASTQKRGRRWSSSFPILSSTIKMYHSVLRATLRCLPACLYLSQASVLTNPLFKYHFAICWILSARKQKKLSFSNSRHEVSSVTKRQWFQVSSYARDCGFKSQPGVWLRSSMPSKTVVSLT